VDVVVVVAVVVVVVVVAAAAVVAAASVTVAVAVAAEDKNTAVLQTAFFSPVLRVCLVTPGDAARRSYYGFNKHSKIKIN
jgi:hypothetical protein